MLETIPGCEKGEEEIPGRAHGNRSGERSPPRSLLLLPATASSAEPGNPLLSKGESSRQVDFFLAHLPLPPERPEPPEEEEKGALPLRFFLFLPDWPEGEEDSTFVSGPVELQRNSPAQSQTPTIQLTHPPLQVDGGSVAQERRSPPHASWSMLNLTRETERERPSQEEENTSSALLPPLVP